MTQKEVDEMADLDDEEVNMDGVGDDDEDGGAADDDTMVSL